MFYVRGSANAISMRRSVSFLPRIARHSKTPGPIMTPVVATRSAWLRSPPYICLLSLNVANFASSVGTSNGGIFPCVVRTIIWMRASADSDRNTLNSAPVPLNVRGPASIAWPQYTGPLKFVAK